MPTQLWSEDFTNEFLDGTWRDPIGPWIPDIYVGGSQVAANGTEQWALDDGIAPSNANDWRSP